MREKVLLILINIAVLLYAVYWFAKIELLGALAGCLLLLAACVKVIGDFVIKRKNRSTEKTKTAV